MALLAAGPVTYGLLRDLHARLFTSKRIVNEFGLMGLLRMFGVVMVGLQCLDG